MPITNPGKSNEAPADPQAAANDAKMKAAGISIGEGGKVTAEGGTYRMKTQGTQYTDESGWSLAWPLDGVVQLLELPENPSSALVDRILAGAIVKATDDDKKMAAEQTEAQEKRAEEQRRFADSSRTAIRGTGSTGGSAMPVTSNVSDRAAEKSATARETEKSTTAKKAKSK